MSRRTPFLAFALVLAAATNLLGAESPSLPAMHWADPSRGRPWPAVREGFVGGAVS